MLPNLANVSHYPHFQGVIQPNITLVDLEDVNTALDALKAHEVTGRMVTIPGLKSNGTNIRR